MPPTAVSDRYLADSVATADPGALIVMLYDRLALDLARAQAALGDGGNLEAAHGSLLHAQDVVLALRASLRPELWEGGDQLMAIYEWLTRSLVEANLRKDPSIVGDCLSVVAPLQTAWRTAVAAGTPADAVA